jgi:t-SNARE complex subunit (syntaxin)
VAENSRLEKNVREIQSTSESGLNSVAEKSKIISNLKSEIGNLSEQNELLKRKLQKAETDMKQSLAQGPKFTDEYK